MIKKIPEVIQPHHIKFLAVGASGFLINFILLYFFHSKLKITLLVAQLLAAEIALLSNFYWHNRWTYKEREKTSLIVRLVQFHGSSWVGIAIATVLLLVCANLLKINYLISLMIGSGVALIWNYSWSNFVIWKNKHST